jgi:hypothetical protein
MSEIDIFQGVGIEIQLADKDDFLKCRETLTRIGVASKSSNTLFQSCHILHKQGRYAIVHFKEMFLLDGKQTDISENDLARRNTIVKLLSEWKLVTVKDEAKTATPIPAPLNQIKIISHKQKKEWQLVQKYTIGRKKD